MRNEIIRYKELSKGPDLSGGFIPFSHLQSPTAATYRDSAVPYTYYLAGALPGSVLLSPLPDRETEAQLDKELLQRLTALRRWGPDTKPVPWTPVLDSHPRPGSHPGLEFTQPYSSVELLAVLGLVWF